MTVRFRNRRLAYYHEVMRDLASAGGGDRRIANFLNRVGCDTVREAVRKYRAKYPQPLPAAQEVGLAGIAIELTPAQKKWLAEEIEGIRLKRSETRTLAGAALWSPATVPVEKGPPDSVTIHLLVPTKGGGGQSTYGYFLATALAGLGQKVAILDFTPSASLMQWLPHGVPPSWGREPDEIINEAEALLPQGGAVVADLNMGSEASWARWMDEVPQAQLRARGIRLVLHGCLTAATESTRSWNHWLKAVGHLFCDQIEMVYEAQGPVCQVRAGESLPPGGRLARLVMPALHPRLFVAFGAWPAIGAAGLEPGVKRLHRRMLQEMERQFAGAAEILLGQSGSWPPVPPPRIRPFKKPVPAMAAPKNKALVPAPAQGSRLMPSAPWGDWVTWKSQKESPMVEAPDDFLRGGLGITGFQGDREGRGGLSVAGLWRQAFWVTTEVNRLNQVQLNWLLNRCDEIRRDEPAGERAGGVARPGQPGISREEYYYRREEEAYHALDQELDRDQGKRDRALETYFRDMTAVFAKRAYCRAMEIPESLNRS